MIKRKDIENYVFSLCINCNEKKVDKTYNDLMILYKTDKYWLDDLYFSKIHCEISELSLNDFRYFILEIRDILLNHFWFNNIKFYYSYFNLIRWIISDLKYWEYGKLSYLFYWDKEIKNFFIEELKEIKDNITDKETILNIINDLNSDKY